jgi:phosphoglycerol geranylgeranyltransferase
MIYGKIIQHKNAGKKQVAILVDPDKVSDKMLFSLIESAVIHGVDYFFVGGSLLVSDNIDETIGLIKESCKIPVVLFPGSPMQISRHADAILFLSLISGRNAEALIGQHVIAAPAIKRSNLEVLPTGYMLIDSGRATTVSYMSNSSPIPSDKPEIAACTAMAGEMLGLKLIYLDAGSGAKNPVTGEMIAQVSKNIQVPLIVGGGIRTAEDAFHVFSRGADLIVIGTAVEKNFSVMKEISAAAEKASKINSVA